MRLVLYYRRTAEAYARWLLDGLAWGESLVPTPLSAKQAGFRTPVDELFPYRTPGLLIVDDEAKRILVAVEMSAHSPMGQNPNQTFDKAVGCARVGVPYVSMFPFSSEVKRSDETSSIEIASGEFFHALRCVREFHKTICVAIPWPGSSDPNSSSSLDLTRVPSPDSEEARDLFSIIDAIITNYELTGHNRPVAIPALDRWNRVVDSLGTEPLVTPQSHRTYDVIRTRELGDYLREFFAVQDHELAALPAGILERMETVVVSTTSHTFRGDPYAGTMFVYDYSLCRTEAAISSRKRNIMPHFRTVDVADALRMLERARVNINRRGNLFFIYPDGASREVLRDVPSAARQFLVGADALVFADGAIFPERFLLPSATIFSTVRPRTHSPHLILFVEGKDTSFLDRVARVLGYPPISANPFIEVEPMGGGDQASYVKATMRVIGKQRQDGTKPRALVVRDRDYKPNVVHRRFQEQLEKHDVEVHVWERKEIENYLLVPSLLARALRAAATVDSLPRQAVFPSAPLPSVEEVESVLMQVTEPLKNRTVSRIVYFQMLESGSDPRLPQIIESILDDFDRKWSTWDGRATLIGGDEGLAAFRRWVQDTYRVSLTYGSLLRALAREDVIPEVAGVIDRIFQLAGT